MTSELLSVDWPNELTPDMTVDEMYSRWKQCMDILMDLYVPHRAARGHGRVSKCLARLIRKRDNEKDQSLVDNLNRKIERASDRQRCLLEQQIAGAKGSARFYGYVTKRLKCRNDLAVLVLDNGTRITDDKDKCEALRQHFRST